MELLKVSSKSKPAMVAGAIAGVVRESGCVEIQAIGAGAVNNAVKAIAIAVGYLASDNINIYCLPSFSEISSDDDRSLTAISIKIKSFEN